MSYDGEICQDCGFPVSHFTGRSWWQADDDLWNLVMGNGAGILCPPCFVIRCRDKGIHVWWKAVEE